jgi:hypothetical protein
MIMNNTSRRYERRCTPAFLTAVHRGLEQPLKSEQRTIPSPAPSTSKTLGVLPRLTAEIGFAMAGRDVSVEILPGTPTTVVFSSGGKLLSLLVLPVSEDEARRTLGIPTIRTCDVAADAWFEEEREQEILDPHELLAAAQQEVWGL